ncbi:PREDICTED: uncharacterized protein LOC105359940, partial [Ceratosolen solmsi marchali]|uniref:Uncharacterized protein LOC105359940 n=1 Tax=Ceratosolen solmsi marchali TaxID=326594 RepID=A0AAJ6YCC3_9HYME
YVILFYRYTGHCPTLKFRVGKRYGACTEEIMKELIEKKILKTGPYRPSSGKETLAPIQRDKDVKRDWKQDSCIYKAPPYILGYTGYIPGYSSRYGLTFMKAVEEGAVEWRELQSKLKTRRDAMRAHNERMDPRNLLSRVRTDNVEVEIDHGHDDRGRRQYFECLAAPTHFYRFYSSMQIPKILTNALALCSSRVVRESNASIRFARPLEIKQRGRCDRKRRLTSASIRTDNQVSAESPPIVGYTGHIPGAKGEVALSKGYAQAAKKGLELLHKERQMRQESTMSNADAVHRVLETAYLDETGHTRP